MASASFCEELDSTISSTVDWRLVPENRRAFFGPRVRDALFELNSVNPPPIFESPAPSSPEEGEEDEKEEEQPAEAAPEAPKAPASPQAIPTAPVMMGAAIEFYHHATWKNGGEAPTLESLRRLRDVEVLTAKANREEIKELGQRLFVDTGATSAAEKQRLALVDKRLWIGLQCDQVSKRERQRKIKWFEGKPTYSAAVLMLSQISSKEVASLQRKPHVKGGQLLQLDPPLLEPYHPLPLVAEVFFDIPGFELSVVDVLLSYEAICLMTPATVFIFDAEKRLQSRRCLADSVVALQSARAASPLSLRTGRCAVLSPGDVAVALTVFPEMPSFVFPAIDTPLVLRPSHGPYKRNRVTTWVDQWEYYIRLEEKRLLNPKTATRMYQLFAAIHINGTDCKLWVVKRILRWELKAKRSLFRFTKLRARILLSARRPFEASSLRIAAPEQMEEGVDPVTVGSSSDDEAGHRSDDSSLSSSIGGHASRVQDACIFAPPLPIEASGGVVLTRSNAATRIAEPVPPTAGSPPPASTSTPTAAAPALLQRKASIYASPEEQRMVVHARMASEAIVRVVILSPSSTSGKAPSASSLDEGPATIRTSAASDSLVVQLAERLIDIVLELEIDLREKREVAKQNAMEVSTETAQLSARGAQQNKQVGFGEGASLDMIKSQAALDAAERANPVGSAVNIALNKFQVFFLHNIVTMRAKGSNPQRGFISLRQVVSDCFKVTAPDVEMFDVSYEPSGTANPLSRQPSTVGAQLEAPKSMSKSEKKAAEEASRKAAEAQKLAEELDPESKVRKLLLPLFMNPKPEKRRGRFSSHAWLSEYDDMSFDVLRRRERCLTSSGLVEEITMLFARLVESIEGVDTDEKQGKGSAAGDKKKEAKKRRASTVPDGLPKTTLLKVPRKQFGTVLRTIVDRMVRRLLHAIITLLSGILVDTDKARHDCEEILGMDVQPSADTQLNENDDDDGASGGSRIAAKPHCFNLFTDKLARCCYPQSFVAFLQGWEWLCNNPLTMPSIWNSSTRAQAASGSFTSSPASGSQLPLVSKVQTLHTALHFNSVVHKGLHALCPIPVAETVEMQPDDLDLLCRMFAPPGQSGAMGAVDEEQFVMTLLHVLDMGHVSLLTEAPPPAAAAAAAAAVAQEEAGDAKKKSLNQKDSTGLIKKGSSNTPPPLGRYDSHKAVFLKWDFFIVCEPKHFLQDMNHLTIAIFERQLTKDLMADVLLHLRLDMVSAWQVVHDKQMLQDRRAAALIKKKQNDVDGRRARSLVPAGVVKDVDVPAVASTAVAKDRAGSSSAPVLAEDLFRENVVKLLDTAPPTEKECFRLIQSMWRTEFERSAPEDTNEWEVLPGEDTLSYLHRMIRQCSSLQANVLSSMPRCERCQQVPSGLAYMHKLQPVAHSATLTPQELDILFAGGGQPNARTTATFSLSHVELLDAAHRDAGTAILALRRKTIERSILSYVDLVLCFDCIPKYFARTVLKRMLEAADVAIAAAPQASSADPPTPAALSRRRRSDLTKAQMCGAPETTPATMSREEWDEVGLIIRKKQELARQKSMRRMSLDEEDDLDTPPDADRDDDDGGGGGGGLFGSGAFRKKKKKKSHHPVVEDETLIELQSTDGSVRQPRVRRNLLEDRLSAQLKNNVVQQVVDTQRSGRKVILVEERSRRIELVTEFVKVQYQMSQVNFGHLEEAPEGDCCEPDAALLEGLAAAISAALASMGGRGKNNLLEMLNLDDMCTSDEEHVPAKKPPVSKFASKKEAPKDATLRSKSGRTIEELEEFVTSETAKIRKLRAQDEIALRATALEEARKELHELVSAKQRLADKEKLERQLQKKQELAAGLPVIRTTNEDGGDGPDDSAQEGGKFSRKKRHKVAKFVEEEEAVEDPPEDEPKKEQRPPPPPPPQPAPHKASGAGKGHAAPKEAKTSAAIPAKAKPTEATPAVQRRPSQVERRPSQVERRPSKVERRPSQAAKAKAPKVAEVKPPSDSDSDGSSNFDNSVIDAWMEPDPHELAALQDEFPRAASPSPSDHADASAAVQMYGALVATHDFHAPLVEFVDPLSAPVPAPLPSSAYLSFVSTMRRSSLAQRSGTEAAAANDAPPPAPSALDAGQTLGRKEPGGRLLDDVPGAAPTHPMTHVCEWWTDFEVDVTVTAVDDSFAALNQQAVTVETQRSSDLRTRMVLALSREIFTGFRRLLGKESSFVRENAGSVTAVLRLLDCFGAENIFLPPPELHAKDNRLMLAEGSMPPFLPADVRGVGLQLLRDPSKKLGPLKWIQLSAPNKAQKLVSWYVRQCWASAQADMQGSGKAVSVPVYALAPVSPAPAPPPAPVPKPVEPRAHQAAQAPEVPSPQDPAMRTAGSVSLKLTASKPATPTVASPLGVQVGAVAVEPKQQDTEESESDVDSPELLTSLVIDESAKLSSSQSSRRRSRTPSTANSLRQHSAVSAPARSVRPKVQLPSGALLPRPGDTPGAAVQACFQARLTAAALLQLFQERSYVVLAEVWVYCTHTMYLDLYGAAKAQKLQAQDFGSFSLLLIRSLRLDTAGQELRFDATDADVGRKAKAAKTSMVASQRHQLLRRRDVLAFAQSFLCFCGLEEYAQSLLQTVAAQLCGPSPPPDADLCITPIDCLRLTETSTHAKIRRLVTALHERQTIRNVSPESTQEERLHDAARRVQFLAELGRLALSLWVLGPLREARAALFALGFSPHGVCGSTAHMLSHPSPSLHAAATLVRFAEARMCGANGLVGNAELLAEGVLSKTEDLLVRSILLAAPRRRSHVGLSMPQPDGDVTAAEEQRIKEGTGSSVYGFFFHWNKSQLIAMGMQLLLSAISKTTATQGPDGDGGGADSSSSSRVWAGFRFNPTHFRDASTAHLASFGEAVAMLNAQEGGAAWHGAAAFLPTLNVGLQYCFAEETCSAPADAPQRRRGTVLDLKKQEAALEVAAGMSPEQKDAVASSDRIAVLPFPQGDDAGGSGMLLHLACSEAQGPADAQRAEKARSEHRRFLDDVGIVLATTKRWLSDRSAKKQAALLDVSRNNDASMMLASLLEGAAPDASMAPGRLAHQFDFSVVGKFRFGHGLNGKTMGEQYQTHLLARRVSAALTAIVSEYRAASPPKTAQSVNSAKDVASLLVAPSHLQLPHFARVPDAAPEPNEFAWTIPALPRMMSVVELNDRFSVLANAAAQQLSGGGRSRSRRSDSQSDVFAESLVSGVVNDCLLKSVLFLPTFNTIFEEEEAASLAAAAAASVNVEPQPPAEQPIPMLKEMGPVHELEMQDVALRAQRKKETMSAFELSRYMGRMAQSRRQKAVMPVPEPDSDSGTDLTIQGVAAEPPPTLLRAPKRRTLAEFFVPVLAVAFRMFLHLEKNPASTAYAVVRGVVDSDCLIAHRAVEPSGPKGPVTRAQLCFLHDVAGEFATADDKSLATVVQFSPPIRAAAAPLPPTTDGQRGGDTAMEVAAAHQKMMLSILTWVQCTVRRTRDGLELTSPLGKYRMTIKHLQLLTLAAAPERVLYTGQLPQVTVDITVSLPEDAPPPPPAVSAAALNPNKLSSRIDDQDALLDLAIADATSEDMSLLGFALQYLCSFPATTAAGTRVSRSNELCAKESFLSSGSEPEDEAPRRSILSRQIQAAIENKHNLNSNHLATPRNGFREKKQHAASPTIDILSEVSSHRLPPLSATPQPHGTKPKKAITGLAQRGLSPEATISMARLTLPSLLPGKQKKRTVE